MDELLDAIEYFYVKAPLEGRDKFKQAEQELANFSKSEQAWELCCEILNQVKSGKLELTSRQIFFAANTLKTKMIFDFDKLK